MSYEKKSRRQILQDPPVDTGLIRCICPSTEDDGFTIQCDTCLVWQHAFCVNISHASIPDHYLCDQCSNKRRPKLSKRFTMSKKKLNKLDSEETTAVKRKKTTSKSRIVSRYVHAIFREALERWRTKLSKNEAEQAVLYDHGPFVSMDNTALLTKGVLMDTPVSNQGLFAPRTIPSLRFLMEVTGDVLLKSEFKFDPVHDFVLLGTPLSHIMFYPTLDLCIDTRQFGNKARYIRRSCHPNAELRNIVTDSDKTIHLGLFARHMIEKGQEVTITWSWQRGHIAWKENMNWHHQHKSKDKLNQVIDEEEERRRKLTIRNMLDRFEKEFGLCACTNKRRCLIEHLKRQITLEKPAARKQSAVILLKPKSPLEIDVTTNSPANQSEDDELLDVEGEDIDVEGGSAPQQQLPLLENNSSDDEQAELSSLSSLSSLSVFEDSSADEGKKTSRRKRKHHKRHRHNNHPVEETSASAIVQQPVKVTAAALPRKKLWMRDYLSSTMMKLPPDPVKKEVENEEYTNAVITETKDIPTTTTATINEDPAIDNVTMEKQADININKCDIVTAAVQKEMKEQVEDTIMQEEEPSPQTKPLVEVAEDTIMTEVVVDETARVFDIDDGELSDASTILLDEDELRFVYTAISQQEAVAEEVVITEEALPIENITVEEKEEHPILEEENSNSPLEEEGSKGVLDVDQPVTDEKPSATIEEPENSAPVLSNKPSKPIMKRISLQEYLSKKQHKV